MGCKSSKVEPAVQRLDIQPTKIPTFDDVFNSVADPVNKLCDIGDAFDSAKNNLLDVKNLKSFADKVKDCGNDPKAIMKVVFEDLKANKVSLKIGVDAEGMLTFQKPEVDSSNSDLGTAAQAVYGLYEDGQRVVKAVPSLIKDIQAIAEQCKEFPDKAKGLAEEAGLEGMDAVKAVKNTAENCKQIASLPGTAEALLTTTKDLFETIKSFAP